MGLDFFRRSVELAERYRQPGQRIAHTIQTNGTLLDDEWAAFFEEHGFLVGLSIDGPHEHPRRLPRRQGRQAARFDHVMRGLDAPARRTASSGTRSRRPRGEPRPRPRGLPLPPRRVRRALHAVHPDRRARRRSRSPIANEGWGERVARPAALHAGRTLSPSARSTAERYGRFLIDVFEEWVRRDVGEVFVQMFDVALANWYGEPPGLCVHSETCGLALAIEHTGDLYSCDHFVEPEFKLGNIRETHMIELVASPAAAAFGLDKRDTLAAATAASATSGSPATAAAPRIASSRPPTASPGSTTCAPATRRSSTTSTRRCGRCPSCSAEPGAVASSCTLRGRGRPARPERPVHLRFGP